MSALPNLLVIEPCYGKGKSLCGFLQPLKGFSLTGAPTLCKGIQAFQKGFFDLVLLDLNLKDSQGFDTFLTVQSKFSNVPIIVLTQEEDQNLAIKAVKAGAQDYLLKNEVNHKTLMRSIHYAIERHHVIEDLEEGRKQEHYLATHDVLTGLPNRFLFFDQLNLTILNARRNNTRFSVFFVDLDGFKPVNDQWGHAFGDLVLQRMSRQMQQILRQNDVLARLGGDEFVAIFNCVENPKSAKRVAEKMSKYIRKPLTVRGREISLSSSIGIALFPQDGEDAERLVSGADMAMYQAKKAGGNQIAFFHPSEKI